MTRDELLQKLKDTLEELFEIPPAKVTPDAKLFEELGLDSIDAIDLIVKIQATTGRRVSPQDFKAVRTVGDVLDCIEKLLMENEAVQS
ncbi:MAG: acyl carrier protein [Alphaproteobacteria bacterium]